MSFPRYPKYKDSGVEWLGEVPEHWAVERIRTLFEIKKRIAGELGFDVFSVTQNGIKIKDTESNEGQLSMDYSKYQIVEVGDFAMNPMDLLTGGADIASTRGVTSPDYRVFSIRNAALSHDRYFLYLFTMMYRQQIFFHLGQGSSQLGRWRLPRDEFNNFRFPFPDIEEQRIIGAFLDRETAKIDELVAEQRRLIELLKEKRQAVISHAVTKGLNPNVPLKPSGIEWLGDVPEHWAVPPVFTRYQAVLGKMLDEKKLTGNHPIPYLRNADVNWDHINVDQLPIFDIKPDERERFSLRRGDILICEGGAGVGQTAIWNGELAECSFQKALHRLRPWSDDELPRFFYYCMRNAVETGVVLAGGTATIPHLTGEQLRKYRFPRPPVHEQRQLVEYLDKMTDGFDDLVSEAERAIELLQERRTALIAAAVTGKIDVQSMQTSGGAAHD
jgi:type I restriction enzyme S subunit